MSEPEQLRVVIGRRVRQLREAAGVRQEDLSCAAKALGLGTWNRCRIAALERGEKPIGIEELLLLATSLRSALGKPITVDDLLGTDETVRLSASAQITARGLREVLAGGDPDSRVAVVVELVRTSAAESTLTLGEADDSARRKLGVTADAYAQACRELWGRSLTAERDARLSAPDAGPASLAALRGRVTRQLLAEAQAWLAQNP